MVAGGLWENGEMATGDEFDALLAEAGRTPMRGWEYDCGGRIRLEPPPWDFPGRMLERCRAAASLLDMGTGGGEWLSRLPYRPPLTVATEGWAPNLEIARGRLEPLGIRVVEVEGAPDNHRQGREGDGGGALPFADGTFDLVGNRHESYLPSEVRRVLAPGGCFLTQQVAGDFNREFYALLGEPAPTPEAPHWNLGFARAQLEAAELPPVAGGEGWEVLHFADVGALAWYLLNLPWVFPGFSFRRHRERLRGLHESGKPLAVRQFLFWLEARSPQAARG
ncbi:class I SAM-dependent methyltransferase [Pseudomonas aeruginosa]|nr:class I SAM-dependent methyltransferase [Pseudomonas aeruginosa]